MSASDPYLQPNGVLRNKLGIQDGYEFLAYEKNFVVTRYNEMTVWGYARVSTKGQKAHGNSLEE